MPRRKHWFPVSHDINSDPEMHELTDTYGEWMLSVWLEMLSISDRNEGEIKGTPEYIAKSLTWLFHSNSRRYNTEWRRNKLRMAFEWMSNKGWIRVESDKFIVVNHWKYHRTQERGPHAPILTRPILPKYPKKDTIKSAHKCAYPPDFTITDEIKKWALKNCLPDPDLQLEAFRDFHTSKGSRFIDWPAAFRNWMRNSVRFSNARPGLSRIDEARKRTQETLKRGME